jgi:hypothetical protein
LPLTAEQREAIEAAIRPAKTEMRVGKRGRALLLLAAGVGSGDVAMLVSAHVRTIFKWKARYGHAPEGKVNLADAPRSGRPPSLSRTPIARGSKRRRASRRRTSGSP